MPVRHRQFGRMRGLLAIREPSGQFGREPAAMLIGDL
jgi:hypothetical protein